MLKLHRKTSRAVYRKMKKQKQDPKHLQQLLAKQNNLKLLDIQKNIEELNMLNASQYEQSTNVGQIIENKQIAQIQQQIENDIKDQNTYFYIFREKNQKLKANDKVERQKLRIEKQNYNEIIVNSQKMITQLVEKLYTLWVNLEIKYKQGHAYFQFISIKNQEKRKKNKSKHLQKINTQKSEIQQIIQQISQQKNQITDTQAQKQKINPQNLKNQQNQIQHEIKNIQFRIKQQLLCRNDFLYLLLSSGYYQQNGLLWILQQIAKIQENDEKRVIKIQNKVDFTRGKQFYNPFSKQILKLKIEKDNFPPTLDQKSKIYMMEIFHNVKLERQRLKIASRQLKKRINDQEKNQIDHQKVYIHDNQSSIFPHSIVKRETPSLTQSSKQQYIHQNSIVMVRRNHQNILQKSNIKDIAKSMEVHMRPEKYNYDIKNIYANTRQSLEKWIKGICKQVAVNQTNPIKRQHHKKSEANHSLHEAGRVQTQVSVPFSFVSSKHKKKSNESKQSQLKNKRQQLKVDKNNIKTNMMENRGFSLPLIMDKIDKILPKNVNQRRRKQKNLSQLNPKALELDESVVNLFKAENSKKQSDDKSKKQKIRILRIYPKENHQKVMKFMFGIKINMEEVVKLLY